MTTTKVAISGNTYHVRRELRAMGGEWDAAKQAWWVPAERAGEAKALVEETGIARRNLARRYTGRTRNLTKIGGGRGYLGTDERGRAHFGTACNCEDYPCCGH